MCANSCQQENQDFGRQYAQCIDQLVKSSFSPTLFPNTRSMDLLSHCKGSFNLFQQWFFSFQIINFILLLLHIYYSFDIILKIGCLRAGRGGACL